MLLWIHHFACAQLFPRWLELWQLLPALFYQIKFDQGEERWSIMKLQVLVLPFYSPVAFWPQCHRSRFRQNPSCHLLPETLVMQQLKGQRSWECGWERCGQWLQDWALALVVGICSLLSSGTGGNLPGDRWWKTKSCHWVNGMWLSKWCCGVSVVLSISNFNRLVRLSPEYIRKTEN